MATAANDSTVVKPAQVALQQLFANLRCTICTKFPKNTHVCPTCSEMYCYVCVSRRITAGRNRRNKCNKCSASLRLEQLIKLHCFEAFSDINVDFARLSLNDTESPEVAAVTTGGSGAPAISLDAMDFVVQTKAIPVGRQEPVQGLPPAVQGTFTLRDVHHCRLPWVFSERIVDEMGFKWRLRVSPKGEQNPESPMMDVYVELLHGETGFFEVMLELTNVAKRAYLILAEADTETMVGRAMFLENSSLPKGNVNLNFRYTIRPASYRAKVQIQQRLLNKHAQQLEKLKGNINTFMYYINDYAEADLQDEAFEEYTDHLESTWRVGVHGKHDFAEFILILDDGLPGIYEITLTLTHPTPTCEKRLRYDKRNIQINQRNLFNFRVRWNDLEEYGFVHNIDDMVTVKITIRPVQVDLKRVQQKVADEQEEDEDDDDEEEYDDDEEEYDNDDEEYDDDEAGYDDDANEDEDDHYEGDDDYYFY